MLSDSSYALYLLHFPAISFGCKALTGLGLSGPIGATVAFVVIFAGCLVAALVVHRYVERPLVARLR